MTALLSTPAAQPAAAHTQAMAKAMPGSWPRPARCWGAYGTPPAALALQHLEGQQRQQGSREPPPGGGLSSPPPPPPPPPVCCSGRGCRCAGVLVSPAVVAGEGRDKAGWAGGGRVVLALSSTASDGGDKDGRDIWRDSALRYAGYANEVGESFRNIAPRLVVPSYAISLAYVFGDTIDKGYQDYSDGKGAVAVGKMGFDVLLWQTLASVAAPGLTINLAVRAMSAAMASDQAKRVLSKVARKWTPTAVGLGIIPFIVRPIDDAVTWGMDETVRKWLA